MEEQKIEDVKFTPELKEKLSGFLGFTKDMVFKYVPMAFREKDPETDEYIIPKELWPVFTLKGKTGIEQSEEEDSAGTYNIKTDMVHITSGKRRLQLLASNVLDFKNFRDVDGNLIECKKEGQKIYKTVLQRFPVALQRELQKAIDEQSRLSKEELMGLEF